MSTKSIKKLEQLLAEAKGSGSFNADGLLSSVKRQSMYGGNPMYFGPVDSINPNASVGLTKINTGGSFLGDAFGVIKSLIGLGYLDPGLQGGMDAGLQGGMDAGLQGGMDAGLQGGMDAGLQGGQLMIAGGSLAIDGGSWGSIIKMIAPSIIDIASKGIKKLIGKGYKRATKCECEKLGQGMLPLIMPLMTALASKRKGGIVPVNKGRLNKKNIDGGIPFAALLAPLLIPAAVKGIKKIFGKGYKEPTKKEMKELEGAALPYIGGIVHDLLGRGPRTSGGLDAGLTGGLDAGLTGGVEVHTGQESHPGSLVRSGGKRYAKMDGGQKRENARVRAGSNPWLLHVAKVRSQNDGVPYKDILKMAKQSYSR